MAGIGFDLRRLVDSDAGLLSKVRAYASAGLISAGPWVVTMVGLSAVGLSHAGAARDDDSRRFLAIMTWVFAFSLLTVSGLQMGFTRWLADTLYRRNYDRIATAFTHAISAVGLAQTAVAAVYCVVVGFELRLAVVVTGLYAVVSMGWVALVWLSVIRQYEKILLAFVLGVGGFVLALAAFRPDGGLVGTVGAYLFGASLTLSLMVGLIFRGTERPQRHGRDGDERAVSVLVAVRDYPSLIVVGAVYGAAIWIDKLVFWFGDGVETLPGIYSHPLYDSCFFLAYLTVVPALAVNLVHLETSFYETYRAYFGAILGGFPLGTLEERRVAMTDELRRGAVQLIRLQAAITLFCVLFAEPLCWQLGLPELSARVFRFACIGAAFQVMLQVTMLVQLYFDLRREAAVTACTFLVLNLVSSVWSLHAGYPTWGIGYAVSTLASLLVALVLLDRALAQLHYRTFMRQARAL